MVPFFRAPGVFEGKYCIDGGFSAMYSVPQGQRWDEDPKAFRGFATCR